MIIDKDFSEYNQFTNEKGNKYKINGKYTAQKFSYIRSKDIIKKLYCISSDGIITGSDGKNIEVKKDSSGYKYVYLLTNSGKHNKYHLHKLIMEAFEYKTSLDNDLNRNIIHFKDWNKDNTIRENLQYVSRRELALIQQASTKTTRSELIPILLKFINDSRYSNRDIKKIIPIPGIFVDAYLKKIRCGEY